MKPYRHLHTALAPEALGPYSQATMAKDFIYLSGQIGIDPLTGELVADETEAQIEQIFKNMKAVLGSAELSLDDVIKLTVFIRDLADFPKINELMSQHFSAPYPARSIVEVSGLPKKAAVEIEAIAVK